MPPRLRFAAGKAALSIMPGIAQPMIDALPVLTIPCRVSAFGINPAVRLNRQSPLLDRLAPREKAYSRNDIVLHSVSCLSKPYRPFGIFSFHTLAKNGPVAPAFGEPRR